MNSTIELMAAHRSIRKFTDEPVDSQVLTEIIRAAQCASTSNYVQAYTIINVTDKTVRKEMANLAGGQVWVAKAPVFLVFCADMNRLARACEAHGKQIASGYMEQFIVATVDAAIIAQNTMLAAESLGLGGVYIGGIRNDPQKMSDLLNLPEHVYPVFGMCLGRPAYDPPTKPRLPLEVILKQDRYDADAETPWLQKYDQTTRAYYQGRDSNLRDETWTSQMADYAGQKTRPHIQAFVQSKGFALK